MKSKEAELKESEKELHVKFEKLKRVHAEEKKSLEERKRLFEEEVRGYGDSIESCSTKQLVFLSVSVSVNSSSFSFTTQNASRWCPA